MWAFAGWRIPLYFLLLITPGKWLYALSKYIPITFPANPRRARFFSSKSDLSRVLELVRSEDLDVLVLNEVLREFHQSVLERELRTLGFISFAWGFLDYFPDAALGTLVASKFPADPFLATVREFAQLRRGSRTAALRFRDMSLSVIGCHLELAARELAKEQLEDLVALHDAEKRQGRAVVIAGDCNDSARNIARHETFAALGLSSVTKRATCPLGFPALLRWDLDHIFLPPGWRVLDTRYIGFGSDHLAVAADVVPPFPEPGRILEA